MTDGMKAFEFASKRKKTGKATALAGKFQLEGQTIEVKALKDASLAYLIAQVNNAGEDSMKVVGKVIDFMDRALTRKSSKLFQDIVLGQGDFEPEDDEPGGLEIGEVVEVFQHVVSLVAGGEDPTGSSSASSTRSPRTGARSTARA